jgi:hypothetical protein
MAFPYNDPDRRLFQHLQAILPVLKQHVERIYICPPPSTRRFTDIMAWLEADTFFIILPSDHELRVGELFAFLYSHAANTEPPDQNIHLCYLDRLAFALEGEYRAQFLEDIDTVGTGDLPLIFQRSAKAWHTHPDNYARLEGFVTQIGKNLFDLTLDYGWCHMVIQAGQLHQVMPRVTHTGISMVAEMVLHLQPNILTRDVDWLAWEDPFILGREAAELKRERETSLEETEKRLSYVLPMIDAMTKFACID